MQGCLSNLILSQTKMVNLGAIEKISEREFMDQIDHVSALQAMALSQTF